MCNCDETELTIALILADPLVRLAMERDGITDREMTEVLTRAQAAVLRHQAEAA
jgi:hypothetical protein